MQRNHYLLNNIILPYIHQNRLLSTSRTLAKSSISVEHGSSFSYPTWSYPLASPSANDIDLPSRSAAESSSAAQLRADIKVVHDKPRARWREPDNAAAPELDSSLFPTAHSVSTARRKASASHDDGDSSPETGRRAMYEETVHSAITKVVAIHTRPSTPADPSELATDSALSSASASPTPLAAASVASFLDTSPGETKSPSPNTAPLHRLPPALHALLRARQFRLAVFHLINSPHLSSNTEIISRVAEWMEREGAGKLARRLRRSVDGCEGSSPNTSPHATPGAKVKLPGDERNGEEDFGRWNGYWNIGLIPPPPLDPSDLSAHLADGLSSSGTTARRQRVTNHFNAHLTYLLRKDAPLNRPLSLPIGSHLRTPGASFPAPRPNLRQLRALLYSIRTLERRFNFVPDRRTANLIIGCWLACVQPFRDAGPASNQDTYDPYIVRSDSSGEEWLVEKMSSPRVFKAGEIMALYGIVSRAMEEAVAGVEDRFKRVVRGMKKVDGRWVIGGDTNTKAGPTRANEEATGTAADAPGLAGRSGTATPTASGVHANANADANTQDALERLSRKDEGDIDYDLHIRPFAEMVLRALKRAHGPDEAREVLRWKREMRDRMELLRLGRMRVRQHLGLPVD